MWTVVDNGDDDWDRRVMTLTGMMMLLLLMMMLYRYT